MCIDAAMTESNCALLCLDKGNQVELEQASRFGCLADFRAKAMRLHESTVKCIRTSMETRLNAALSTHDYEGRLSELKSEDTKDGFGVSKTDFGYSPKNEGQLTTFTSGFRLTGSKKSKDCAAKGKSFYNSSKKYKLQTSPPASSEFSNLMYLIQRKDRSFTKTMGSEYYSELSSDLLKSQNLEEGLQQAGDIYSRALPEQTTSRVEEDAMNQIAESLLKQPDSLLFPRNAAPKVPLQLFINSGVSQKAVYMGLMTEGKRKETNLEILKRILPAAAPVEKPLPLVNYGNPERSPAA